MTLSRLRTLRTRVTVVAALALTAAVTLGLLVMYLLQADSARRTVQSQLRTYAAQIEQSARPDGTFPQPLQPSSVNPAAEAQVLAADGTVVAATRTITGLPALYTLPPASNTPVRQPAADRALPAEVSVHAEHATVAGRPVTVLTGSSNSLLSQVNETFGRLLAIGLPALLLLASTTVWLVVGRALRPVERIRRAVTDITAADLAARVPEPASTDEIGNLARTMNAMLERLEDSAARQRRFVADASHELRSPLTAIRTSLEVGLAHPDRAPWPAIAERGVRQATRLEDLIAQLLLLARADAGRAAHHAQRVELAPLLEEIRTSTPTPARVTLTISTPPGTATTGDPADLTRLFRNVLDNAVRHARTAVSVTVETSAEPPGALRVAIADDGPGIPPMERDRIFDRFVRLDASRTGGATGLGLAIAKEIAAAHGGSIYAAEPEVRPGALFVVLLRAAPEQEESDPPGL